MADAETLRAGVPVTVRIPTPLRGFTGGADSVTVSAATVGEALAALGDAHPGILERVLGADGEPRQFVNLYLGADDVRRRQGLATPLAAGEVLAIIPAVAGGAPRAREQRLQELRQTVPQLTPAEALALQAQGALLVDVREADEIAQGSALGALPLGRGFLELKIEEAVPDYEKPLVTMCAGGVRSLFAAESLLRLGYRRVYSLAGGFARWKAEGLPWAMPSALSRDERERYSRHLAIPEVGEAGQAKLLASRVLLVGAGGLGCPAALYLAAAGVGTLGLVDDDRVDRSNLQRQVLHGDGRVGQLKVDSARASLAALNPAVRIDTWAERLTRDNVERIFAGYDVIVDGSDNFPTRYLVNDACVRLGLPNVHGSVYRFEGQVSVFWPAYGKRRGPCYRCLYPAPPPPELAPSCAEAGVLGVLPGVVGLLEAVETIKLLLDLGDPLVGRLLCYDALAGRFSEYALAADPHCAYCGEGKAFPGYADYAGFCRAAA
ncbi:molybdopterin-synthase adenylyltransferase MoeB [Azospira restricta]|uniref:Molybdopterin-synthase adenylyltransferase n=1 Tax=Azospira restricta TaxID=404405 RepID=A0A974SQ29_9RHOO|nr:molybdopterin-synthase adenylyltransferase MoeB [Azospira restricta]QRJ64372.1 molybdopterin-synthase adenylyltransferase MoeB [Azospira restricta]